MAFFRNIPLAVLSLVTSAVCVPQLALASEEACLGRSENVEMSFVNLKELRNHCFALRASKGQVIQFSKNLLETVAVAGDANRSKSLAEALNQLEQVVFSSSVNDDVFDDLYSLRQNLEKWKNSEGSEGLNALTQVDESIRKLTSSLGEEWVHCELLSDQKQINAEEQNLRKGLWALKGILRKERISSLHELNRRRELKYQRASAATESLRSKR